ncbi:MAG: hypothetical protein JEZ00_11760 [Anaerolineaceae bacterium]|nr:hypothetical protein [Anaerolineaceae bacterium]
MLLLIVPVFLILSGWTIYGLHKLNRKSGMIWLVAVIIGVISLIGWGGISAFRDTQWMFDFSGGAFGLPDQLSFQMNSFARGAGVFSLAYLMFVINAWMVKLEETHLFVRIKNFFVTLAFALILYCAENLFTWLVILIIMDMVELLNLFAQIRNVEQVKKSYASILVRFAGSLIFMVGWLLSINLTAATVISREVLVFAMLLRLFAGMLRIHPGANLIERSLGDFEEVPIFLAIHFVFFMRFPIGTPFPIWIKNLVLIGSILMIYHLIQWLIVRSRVVSMKHYLYFMIFFILLYSHYATAAGNLILLFIFLLSMAMLYLRPIKHKYDIWFTLPLYALLLSLPYLPTAAVWNLQSVQFNSLFIPFAGFLVGFLSRFDQQKPMRSTYERWMLVVYPAGYLPILAGIVYLVFMKDIPVQAGNILFSLIIVVISILLVLYSILRKREIIKPNKSFQWVSPLFDAIWKRVSVIFNSRWIVWLLDLFWRITQRIISFFNDILEGDGGLLWAIVLLILFLSVVRSLQG